MTEDKPLTERDIQRGLMWKFCGSQDVRMVNYTPGRWWECDLIRVTPAGYWYEYEVKLTKSDFKRDAEKYSCVRIQTPGGWWRYSNQQEYKHDLLTANDPRGPKQFWFAFPAELIPMEQVPEWAGVVWATRGNGGRIKTEIKRKAPIRKTEKMSREAILRIKESAYHRYVNGIWEGR